MIGRLGRGRKLTAQPHLRCAIAPLAEPETDTMPSVETVRIRLMWFPQAQLAGYHVAEQRELGHESGVRIVCEPIDFADSGIDALLNGRVDLAVRSPSHLLASLAPVGGRPEDREAERPLDDAERLSIALSPGLLVSWPPGHLRGG